VAACLVYCVSRILFRIWTVYEWARMNSFLSSIYSNEVLSSSNYLSGIRSVFLLNIVKYKQMKCKLLLNSRRTNYGCICCRIMEVRGSNLGLFVGLPEWVYRCQGNAYTLPANRPHSAPSYCFCSPFVNYSSSHLMLSNDSSRAHATSSVFFSLL
jgi:hypothetical protein